MVENSAYSRNPTVSIIVPFYNVKECVSYCLDSLLAQTYDDYEIICVDDGSTDGTLDLLEEYAKTHDRIRVVSQKNGGAASARNNGVAQSHGKYISFVDGDDIVSPFYLEALVRNIEGHTARMVVGTHKDVPLSAVFDTNEIDLHWDVPESIRVLSRQEMMEEMLYEEVLSSACMRLASREIYERNPFPEGMYYEDIATGSVYAAECDSFIRVDEPIYGYVMKPGSVVHRKSATMKQALDYEESIERFIRNAAPYVESDVGIHCFRILELIRLYRLLQKVGDEDKRKIHMEDSIRKYVRDHKDACVNNGRVLPINRFRARLMAGSPWLLMRLSDIYDRRVKSVRYE